MIKKFIVLIISIVMLFVITACGANKPTTQGEGGNQSETPEPNNNESPEEDEPVIKEIVLDDAIETDTEIEASESEAIIKVIVKNTSDQDLKLMFTTSQRMDYVIKNEAGNEVYSYSIDKMFLQAIEELELKAGESIEFEDRWNYQTNSGERLPAGTYTLEARAVPSEVNGKNITSNVFQNSKTFEIPAGNNAFRIVKVAGENGEYTVTGEARIFEASFFYSVEDGHDYIIKETPHMADKGAPEWGNFEFKLSIPKEKLPKNGALILHLYERSAKDGSIINTLDVLLEQFN